MLFACVPLSQSLFSLYMNPIYMRIWMHEQLKCAFIAKQHFCLITQKNFIYFIYMCRIYVVIFVARIKIIPPHAMTMCYLIRSRMKILLKSHIWTYTPELKWSTPRTHNISNTFTNSAFYLSIHSMCLLEFFAFPYYFKWYRTCMRHGILYAFTRCNAHKLKISSQIPEYCFIINFRVWRIQNLLWYFTKNRNQQHGRISTEYDEKYASESNAIPQNDVFTI